MIDIRVKVDGMAYVVFFETETDFIDEANRRASLGLTEGRCLRCEIVAYKDQAPVLSNKGKMYDKIYRINVKDFNKDLDCIELEDVDYIEYGDKKVISDLEKIRERLKGGLLNKKIKESLINLFYEEYGLCEDCFEEIYNL